LTVNRRLEIVRRAAEIFARKGVASTSMEDIATAVGIKREGVYYYFKNRSAILLEIIQPQSNALLRNLERIHRSNASPVDKLRSAIGSHLDSYNPNYIEMSVALREVHFTEEQSKLRKLQNIWDGYEKLWAELIAEGQARDAFAADLDPKLVTLAILGMCNWVCRWYRPEGEFSIAQIADTYSTIIVSGLVTGDAALLSPGSSLGAPATPAPAPVK